MGEREGNKRRQRGNTARERVKEKRQMRRAKDIKNERETFK